MTTPLFPHVQFSMYLVFLLTTEASGKQLNKDGLSITTIYHLIILFYLKIRLVLFLW